MKFLILFQSLKEWGTIDEPETGWDPDDEDISDVLKEHKKMRKMKKIKNQK